MQVLHMFGHLNLHHNAEMVFDPSDPAIDENLFDKKDWASSEFGSELSEQLPPNMPEPRGMGFVMSACADAPVRESCVVQNAQTPRC